MCPRRGRGRLAVSSAPTLQPRLPAGSADITAFELPETAHYCREIFPPSLQPGALQDYIGVQTLSCFSYTNTRSSDSYRIIHPSPAAPSSALLCAWLTCTGGWRCTWKIVHVVSSLGSCSLPLEPFPEFPAADGALRLRDVLTPLLKKERCRGGCPPREGSPLSSLPGPGPDGARLLMFMSPSDFLCVSCSTGSLSHLCANVTLF